MCLILKTIFIAFFSLAASLAFTSPTTPPRAVSAKKTRSSTKKTPETRFSSPYRQLGADSKSEDVGLIPQSCGGAPGLSGMGEADWHDFKNNNPYKVLIPLWKEKAERFLEFTDYQKSLLIIYSFITNDYNLRSDIHIFTDKVHSEISQCYAEIGTGAEYLRFPDYVKEYLDIALNALIEHELVDLSLGKEELLTKIEEYSVFIETVDCDHAHIDHIQPKSLGGANIPQNAMILPAKVNMAKSDKRILTLEDCLSAPIACQEEETFHTPTRPAKKARKAALFSQEE